MASIVDLTKQQKDALRLTAGREQRSREAVALCAIDLYASDRAGRVSEAIDRVMVEDKKLMDNLA